MYETPLKYAQRQEARQISRQEKKENVFFFIYREELFIAKVALIPKWIAVQQKKQNKNKRFCVQLILWLTSQGALVLSLLIVPRKTRLV